MEALRHWHAPDPSGCPSMCMKGCRRLLHLARAAETERAKGLLAPLVNDHEMPKGLSKAMIGARWRKLKGHALTNEERAKQEEAGAEVEIFALHVERDKGSWPQLGAGDCR